MADDNKLGRVWQDDELDLIVADYFNMLAAELAGAPYIKAHHSAQLMGEIGRTHRSVEFKHQNISAVLEELGLPWIRGYKPKRNYQSAIFGAIDRYLSNHPSFLDEIGNAQRSPALPDSVFVPAPSSAERVAPVPGELRQLVQKFDPSTRDFRNRRLGRAGEEFVLDLERSNLTRLNRSDLARQVRWVADEDGDGAGYDILSFAPGGDKRLIEVKTTNGSARTPFFLTRNECAVADNEPECWRIYRVHLFAVEPHIFTIAPPLERALKLVPESWRALL